MDRWSELDFYSFGEAIKEREQRRQSLGKREQLSEEQEQRMINELSPASLQILSPVPQLGFSDEQSEFQHLKRQPNAQAEEEYKLGLSEEAEREYSEMGLDRLASPQLNMEHTLQKMIDSAKQRAVRVTGAKGQCEKHGYEACANVAFPRFDAGNREPEEELKLLSRKSGEGVQGRANEEELLEKLILEDYSKNDERGNADIEDLFMEEYDEEDGMETEAMDGNKREEDELGLHWHFTNDEG